MVWDRQNHYVRLQRVCHRQMAPKKKETKKNERCAVQHPFRFNALRSLLLLPPVLFCSVSLSLSLSHYSRGVWGESLCARLRRTRGHCHFELGIKFAWGLLARADGRLGMPLPWWTTTYAPPCTVRHSSPYDLQYVGVGLYFVIANPGCTALDDHMLAV